MTYAVGKAWWGKGIATEALKAVMAFLFERVGANRIEAGHDVNNPGSGRVMQKAGMQQEGIHRQAGRKPVDDRADLRTVAFPEERDGNGRTDSVFHAKLLINS